MLLNSQTILSNYNKLKKENKRLAKEYSTLKYENNALKENVQDQSLDGLRVENQMLHQKVKTLTKDLANFVKGIENLERLLG